jgi:hypothetical protein
MAIVTRGAVARVRSDEGQKGDILDGIGLFYPTL